MDHERIPDAGAPRPARHPGLKAGMGSVLRGFAFVATTPRCWPYALVPAAILLLLVGVSFWLSLATVKPWIVDSVAGPDLFSQSWAWLLGWLGAIVAALLGLVVALLITPPLSGPALEHVVAQQEAALGAPVRQPIGVLRELWFGVKAQLAAWAVGLPLLLLLWLVDVLFPAALLVTLPLKVLVSGLTLAWGLFDYPLTLRGVPIRKRFQLVRAHKAALLGFGVAFAVLVWIPCCSVFLLPVGVAGATRLLWQLLAADPNLLPELPRGADPSALPTAGLPTAPTAVAQLPAREETPKAAG